MELSDLAQSLHDTLSSDLNKSKMFTQHELTEITGISNLSSLMQLVQELLNNNLIKLIKQNNELKFQGVSMVEAQKKLTMSSEEALVYSYIEASGRDGIWSKTIKARTNLHQHVVLKCLKNLENQRFVKSVKSVKYPTRKMYMLYHLQPSVSVTGGAWFTDGELDVEFIDSLLAVVWRFVCEKTVKQGPHEYVEVSDIANFITQSKVSTVELGPDEVKSLCSVLEYDGRLEKTKGGDGYRATLYSLKETETLIPNADKDQIVDDDGDFDIFQHSSYTAMTAQQLADKECVYFDEWAL